MVLVQRELKNAYIGEYKNPERIEYKMNADSNGKLYLGIQWTGISGMFDAYSWKVSVDGWAETTYTWGTSNWRNNIALTWYTPWSNHTIMITPTTEAYLWARAYWWNWKTESANVTEIVYDGSYMWYGESATSTGNYFKMYQYLWCTALTSIPEEVLPNTITTIPTYFRYWQYWWCTSLTYSPEEVLPDSVTSIWTYFRCSQYNWCYALTEIKWWKDLSIGSAQYRRQQYTNCTSNKTVKVLSDVWYEAYTTDALQNAYVTSVNVPNAYLNNFKNTSIYPRAWIDDSKFIWY